VFQYAFLVLSLYTYNIFCNIQEELDKLNKASENINRIELLLEVCYILCMKTRSSATTEKQRISCACLPRLPNWSCNAQNTAESQRLYYFWHSNALIQELLADNAFCHEIAAEGHSLCKPRGTPMNIPINLIFLETRIIGLHFCRWWYGSIFIQIWAVGSKRRIFSASECILAVQGHPRSMILVPIESAYATSY